MSNNSKGRVTIPTDLDIINQTKEIMEKWGADALRDCDGTLFPVELKETGAKIYATYYTTRKDNEWAKANLDEVQQCYLMTGFVTAEKETLEIKLLSGISPDLMAINFRDDIKRWWEVIDRTTGEVIGGDKWSFDEDAGVVKIVDTTPYHEYTVSFLAYLIWDPVNMYNAVVNDWEGFEPEITFDVRQPKTKEFSMKRLRRFLEDNSHVDVVRFTTFFHQFTLVFDELRRQKYVDWYGYSASVSPYILEQFEEEVGYKFRAEFIIDEGYHNNQYRNPSKEFKDFMAFQRREVAKLAKEMVDICHEFGKEAMMFLGDHFIGCEPYMEEFATIGLDAVVGSVGNASTLRLISDIKGVTYTEGRFLPYFFPDTFHEGGDPLKEGRENWLCARRAMMRQPVDRIGYGGYLKLALDFPEFVDYIEHVCDEFRMFYEHAKAGSPFTFAKVAVLNAWGKARSWGVHMVHHALYQKQNYSYAGIIEILAGGAYDVNFISFDDILENPELLDEFDVIFNVGDHDTAHTGGDYWQDERIVTAVRKFVAEGGGFIGVGEPSGNQWQGRTLQLASLLGVEKETGFTLGYDKYNWDEKEHFITAGMNAENIDFGEASKGIFALENTQILVQKDKEVQLAVNDYFNGRSVYIGGLPYSPDNARLLHRAIMWSIGADDKINKWISNNPLVDVHAYPESGRFCVCNNASDEQITTVYTDSKSFEITLKPEEIQWFDI